MVNFVCPLDRLPLDKDLKCPRNHQFKFDDGVYDFLGYEPKNNDVLEKVAPLYEGVWAPLGFLITGRSSYSKMLKDAAHYANAREFLDVGTGPGKIFDYVDCRECYGLDISRKFLKILKAKRPNVISVRGDAKALPFPDESFSGVSSIFVIHMLDEPSKALSEISRVLRRGGKCSIGVLTSRGSVANLLSKWWKLELKAESFYIGSLENLNLRIYGSSHMGPWTIFKCQKQ
ncbi:class I SAM-dependent methyltransferase [Metallosphaera tengchongensis]|uniref:Class I SAM-dependent methyltransferase n=1 Tax=Metallosphaera tengchongensis TaxID=1532350 RepID=A0A6N0NU48_9CREN|nr:class I SAM-dependent methyltransferase [Metallosphaera tengchongensis]QKQ99656.1 class I SAM-dependent methyltransferase [Metallosphaera tengchongensis]